MINNEEENNYKDIFLSCNEDNINEYFDSDKYYLYTLNDISQSDDNFLNSNKNINCLNNTNNAIDSLKSTTVDLCNNNSYLNKKEKINIITNKLSELNKIQNKYIYNNLLYEKNNDKINNKKNESINYIYNYIYSCIIYLDSIIKLLKLSYINLKNLCYKSNNKITYNTYKIQFIYTLMEINKIIIKSHFCGIPIFINNCNNYKFVKFAINTDKNYYNEEKFFKIKLIKISLEYLNISKYILPLLKKNDIMTCNTNPIPEFNCKIGENPKKYLYKNKYLIKNWDPKYHLNIFNKAIFKTIIYKKNINNKLKILNIKKIMYDKIKQI